MERGGTKLVLEKLRKNSEILLDPLARYFQKVNPNALSWTALLFAIVAGLMIYFSYWFYHLLLSSSLMIMLNGIFDALDGKVARISGKASKSGDFVDHVLDRYADVFMVGAIGISGWCNPYIGIFAVIGVLLTSYMGTQAQAVGVGRLYGGLLGRADRGALLFIAPLIQCLLIQSGIAAISVEEFAFSTFDIVMLWFGIVGNITAIQRAYVIWKKIK